MIGCNNCAGLSLEENLSRGNKYLMIDTHFKKSESITSIENVKNDESEKEKGNSRRISICSPLTQHTIVTSIHA